MTDKTEYIKEAREKYDSYGNEWEKAFFDEKSGGFNVYHKNHQFATTDGGGDAEKREAITREVGKMLKLGRIGEMPDIYYMNKRGLLKLFWKK